MAWGKLALQRQGNLRYPTSERDSREVYYGDLLPYENAAPGGGVSPALFDPPLCRLSGRYLGVGHAGHHGQMRDAYRADLGVCRAAPSKLRTLSGGVPQGSAGGQSDTGRSGAGAAGRSPVSLRRRVDRRGYHADPEGMGPDAGSPEVA